MKIELQYINVNSLTPYENNARKHDSTDINAIKASIKENGFLDPIGVWGPQNVIVEGHGRYLAAKQLGIIDVPCIRLDHLTDAQRREYALVHNRTAELSSWDFSKLEGELEKLSNDTSFNLDGWENFDFSDLIGEREQEVQESYIRNGVEQEIGRGTVDEGRIKESAERDREEAEVLRGPDAEDRVLESEERDISLKSTIVISYTESEKELLKQFIGERNIELKQLYTFSEIMANLE